MNISVGYWLDVKGLPTSDMAKKTSFLPMEREILARVKIRAENVIKDRMQRKIIVPDSSDDRSVVATMASLACSQATVRVV